MPFSKLLIAATLVAAAAADVPTFTSKYCADVVEVGPNQSCELSIGAHSFAARLLPPS